MLYREELSTLNAANADREQRRVQRDETLLRAVVSLTQAVEGLKELTNCVRYNPEYPQDLALPTLGLDALVRSLGLYLERPFPILSFGSRPKVAGVFKHAAHLGLGYGLGGGHTLAHKLVEIK